MPDKLFGGIEAGGSKFVCAVGTAPDKIVSQTRIPTTTPTETLASVIEYFSGQPKLTAIGIGSFGPLNLDIKSGSYGFITSTPKPGWQNTDLIGPLEQALRLPITLDTDVNAAALGEQLYGAASGLDSAVYITVGTGIGAGCIVNNQIVRGRANSEVGHMLIPRLSGDGAPSSCRYHDNCWEGLASASALKVRYGQSAESLKVEEAWATEARYLATGVSNVILTLAPQRVIIGGGVMAHAGLLESVRSHVAELIHGYVALPPLEGYLVSPQLKDLSGITGALVLAQSKA